MFAERGFDGVSVRDIVQAAEVNLAAVSYYFGSKGELLLEVFSSRARELNRERRALLREAEARHGGNPPLADILRALMARRSSGAIRPRARTPPHVSSPGRWPK